VAEPRFDRARQRVTGVLLDPSDGGEPEFVPAGLVVDAAGRGTRLPVWLEQWGFQRPVEQTVDIGIHYATHRFRVPAGLIAEKVVVAGASHDQSLGLGMLFYEDGARPPRTFPEMVGLADELLPAHISAALARAEPFGEPAFHAFPASRWRRYHRLKRFPVGIVPLGDAVASFNPTFGQGMTMTSLQAGHLRRALRLPDDQVAAALNRATARTTYPVWMMNGVADVHFHHAVTEPTPWWWKPSAALFDQFLGAAETDRVLAEWFLRRFSLLDSLYFVPPPRIIGRAMAHNMRLWARERRQAARERRQDRRAERRVVTAPRSL
jgi:hypothetical protein